MYEHSLHIIDDVGGDSLPEGLFPVGTIVSVICDGQYSFSDGTRLRDIICDSVFDPEIGAFVVKWKPDLEKCNLYLAY